MEGLRLACHFILTAALGAITVLGALVGFVGLYVWKGVVRLREAWKAELASFTNISASH